MRSMAAGKVFLYLHTCLAVVTCAPDLSSCARVDVCGNLPFHKPRTCVRTTVNLSALPCEVLRARVNFVNDGLSCSWSVNGDQSHPLLLCPRNSSTVSVNVTALDGNVAVLCIYSTNPLYFIDIAITATGSREEGPPCLSDNPSCGPPLSPTNIPDGYISLDCTRCDPVMPRDGPDETTSSPSTDQTPTNPSGDVPNETTSSPSTDETPTSDPVGNAPDETTSTPSTDETSTSDPSGDDETTSTPSTDETPTRGLGVIIGSLSAAFVIIMIIAVIILACRKHCMNQRGDGAGGRGGVGGRGGGRNGRNEEGDMEMAPQHGTNEGTRSVGQLINGDPRNIEQHDRQQRNVWNVYVKCLDHRSVMEMPVRNVISSETETAQEEASPPQYEALSVQCTTESTESPLHKRAFEKSVLSDIRKDGLPNVCNNQAAQGEQNISCHYDSLAPVTALQNEMTTDEQGEQNSSHYDSLAAVTALQSEMTTDEQQTEVFSIDTEWQGVPGEVNDCTEQEIGVVHGQQVYDEVEPPEENTTRPKKICIPIRPHGPKSNSWRIYGNLLSDSPSVFRHSVRDSKWKVFKKDPEVIPKELVGVRNDYLPSNSTSVVCG